MDMHGPREQRRPTNYCTCCIPLAWVLLISNQSRRDVRTPDKAHQLILPSLAVSPPIMARFSATSTPSASRSRTASTKKDLGPSPSPCGAPRRSYPLSFLDYYPAISWTVGVLLLATLCSVGIRGPVHSSVRPVNHQ